MIIIFILLCLALILSFEYIGDKNFNKKYIAPKTMLPWKGFFIMLIFMSHLTGNWGGDFNILDEMYVTINNYIGQLVVVLFLFLSGYGVIYSIDHKGNGYLKEFPKNRIFKTWMHFALIVLLYLMLQFVLGTRYRVKTVVLALIGLESLGNSNWYIFAILFLYISSLCSFNIVRILSKKIKISANLQLWISTCFTMLFVLSYIFIFRKVLQYITVWYDSIICYVFGMFYYLLEERIVKQIQYNERRYVGCLIFNVCVFGLNYMIFFFIRPYNYLIYFTIQAVLLITFILFLSMKFKSKSKILSWCGENLFLIYILQRIPFIILDYIGVNNLYIYFGVSAMITIFLTILAGIVFNRLDNVVFEKN